MFPRSTRLARGLSSNTLIVLAIAFMVLLANHSFFDQTLAVYTLDRQNVLPLLVLPLGLGAATALLAGLFAFGRLTKPVLAVLLVVSAASAYFMDSFGVVLNDEMLQNVAQTNVSEAGDQITFRLFGYLMLLGVVPVLLMQRIPLLWRGWRRELLARGLLLGGSVVVLVAIGASFGSFYSSFIREHKQLRSYANPTYPLYGLFRFVQAELKSDENVVASVIGADARRVDSARRPRLIIVVVGETARADRFSLNGYARQTNPELSREDVISFSNLTSCGTSTAISVPCMFSSLGREGFSIDAALRQENVLDILQRAGAYVHWLDNNSDSKGAAKRIPFEDFRTAEKNPLCDDECRDEGMLGRAQELAAARTNEDVVIVLHQMGNHGPAYYKRYPPAFERFKPACQNKDLSRCSIEEIGNAYDNAILYTDHFLGQTVAMLKRFEPKFDTAMFYLSDHGESLGENGLFLHGLPYALAPREQIHVPAVMWFGKGFDAQLVERARARKDQALSHDHLFHTLLGFLGIETSEYRAQLDILGRQNSS